MKLGKIFFFFLLVLLSAGVLADYLWMTRSAGYPRITAYNRLADALFHGRFDLETSIDPIVLEDPYNKAHYNNSVPMFLSVFDHSIYRQKVYLYFGPSAVLAFYMPYRLITLTSEAPDHAAIVFFCFGAFLFSAAFLWRLARTYFNGIPRWMIFFCIAVTGFSNGGPWLCRTDGNLALYTVPIAANLFFLTGALFFLSVFSLSSPRRGYWLFAAGLFAGLSVASRSYMLFVVPVLTFFLWKRTALSLNAERPRLRMLFLGPLLVCLGGLAFYNYVRFENVFETGLTYQVGGFNEQLSAINVDFNRAFTNAYFYLFHPPEITSVYPFVYPTRHVKWPVAIFPNGTYRLEFPIGIFACAPFIFMMFLSPLVYWAAARPLRKAGRLRLLTGSLAVTGLIYYAAGFWVWISGPFLKWVPVAMVMSPVSKFVELVPPFFIFVFVFLLRMVRRAKDRLERSSPTASLYSPAFESKLLAWVGTIPLIGCLAYGQCTFRYLADFLNTFVLLAVLLWFVFDRALAQDRPARWLLRTYGVMLGFISIFLGIFLPIDGYTWVH